MNDNFNRIIEEELIELRKEKRRREAIAYLAPVVFVCLLTVSILIYLTHSFS